MRDDLQEDLARRAATGDAAALHDLLGHIRPGVVRRCARFLPCPQDAEESAQDVLLQVARNIHRFEGDAAQFRSWAFTIAHRQLIDQHRRTARTAKVISFEEGAGVTSEPARADVDEALQLQWSSEGTAALLERLSPDQRDVVLLRLVGGFSIAEVAEILEKEPNAIKQLQHRGVHSLRRLLAAEQAVPAPGEVVR